MYLTAGDCSEIDNRRSMQCISLITSARIGIRSISPYSAWDINSCILGLVTSCSRDGSSWLYAETCNPAYTSFGFSISI